MPRNATGKMLLLFCPLLLLSVVACGGGANPTPLVVPPTPAAQGTLDMKPVLRDFLAGLPADWHLATSEDVAKTKPFIVDVRQPEEYSQGFIDGAVNIPLRELAQNLQALPGMDKDIVLVCDNGHRSAIGMAILQMLGYSKAKSLADGMNAWQAAKLPVVTAPVPRRPAGPAPKVNAQLQAMLDYYLVHTLPFDWGIIDPAALTEDQKLKSSSEMDVQPETFDQGPSLLVDVDEADEFAKANLNPTKSINAPLRSLPASLENIPLQETINWA
jgi:rhodanese-related sulfurtransferase